MSLKLIYGRSGSGKSNYVYDEIKNNINGNSKIYIITPEQFSFTAEKKLMNALSFKQSAVINAEVLTFGRMAFRVISEVRTGKIKLIYLNAVKQC